MKIPDVWIFVGTSETGKKGHSDNLELSESSEFAVKRILCSDQRSVAGEVQ